MYTGSLLVTLTLTDYIWHKIVSEELQSRSSFGFFRRATTKRIAAIPATCNRPLSNAGAMMEGTDLDEMGGGASSVQQQSAKCKFERLKPPSRSKYVEASAFRVDLCMNPTASPETSNMNIGSVETGKACSLQALTFIESVCLPMTLCWAVVAVLQDPGLTIDY
jgi:hypothetical protein